jgi:hypothetical protein
MPQFVAQILSLDGDVILSNVDVSIDFSPQGPEWRGNFDLPPTSTFDPNSLPQRKMYKIQLNDGRTGEMFFSGMMPARHTGKYNLQFEGRDPLQSCPSSTEGVV